MKLQIFKNGYNLWLSKNDTYNWAHKSGARWPCSTLSDKSIFVAVDNNGLCDFTINGRQNYNINYDGNELMAIVGDHTQGTNAQIFWPNWI